MMTKTRLLVGSLGAASLFLAGSASAELLAQDSYITGTNEYSPGGLAGQTSDSAVGFTGAWSVSSANLQVEAGGILDGDAALGDPSNGQGKFLAAPGQFSSAFRSARHDLAPVTDPANSTFYMSHLVNAGTLAGNGDTNEEYAFVGFGDFVVQDTIEGNANFLGGAFVGFVNSATAADGVDLVIRSRTGAAAGVIGDELLVSDAENTTYNVVMALEYNNPGDEVRWWLNPTDFSNDEAGLTASAQASGSIAGFQLGAASSMNDLTVVTRSFDRSFFWDESTLATSVAAVPEPATAALLGLGGLAMLRRR
jgi:hypothetical protein